MHASWGHDGYGRVGTFTDVQQAARWKEGRIRRRFEEGRKTKGFRQEERVWIGRMKQKTKQDADQLPGIREGCGGGGEGSEQRVADGWINILTDWRQASG